MQKVNVAIVGCGNISGIYLENITKTFKEIELIGVCDLKRERAENGQKALANGGRTHRKHTECHAFAVVKPSLDSLGKSRKGFDRVTYRVTEIEYAAKSRLALVLFDDGLLDFQRSENHLVELFHDFTLFKPLEECRIKGDCHL